MRTRKGIDRAMIEMTARATIRAKALSRAEPTAMVPLMSLMMRRRALAALDRATASRVRKRIRTALRLRCRARTWTAPA
jgi:hypothetical protein